MTDRINLTQLREWANEFIDIPPGIIDHDQTMARGVLALIDAVEAAQRFHDVTPDSFSETHIEASDRLRQALNRFNHT